MVKYEEIDKKYTDSKNFLQPLHKKFNNIDELYWGVLNYKNNPWKSQVVDPEVFEKVERVTSHCFASKPRGKVEGRQPEDDLKASVADEFLKYQWDLEGQDMQNKLERVGKTAYLYGTSFALMCWKYERVKKNMEGKEKYATTFDSWYLQDLNIYDCFPDPSASSIGDMQWFILNEYTTLSNLENENVKINGENRYSGLKTLKEAMKEDEGDASFSTGVPAERDKVRKIRGFNSDKANGRILVRRYFDKNKWVTIVPEYELVIEDRNNPYSHGGIPILCLVDQTVPGQLFGLGEVEPISKLQKGLNNVLNQRLDTVRLIMNSPIKVRASSKYAPTWTMKPGAIWKVDDMGDVEVVSIPDVTANTFAQTTGYFKDAIARAGGYQDFLTRNDTSKEKTAAEVHASQAEQNARLRTKEQHVDEFVKNMMGMALKLNAQYVKKPQLIRVIGRESIKALNALQALEPVIYKGNEVAKFQPSPSGDTGYLVIEPTDLFTDFDYSVEMGSTLPLDPATEIGTLTNMIYMLMKLQQNLMQEGTQIKFAPLVERLLAKAGIKNIDQIVAAEQQMPDPSQMGGQPQLPQGLDQNSLTPQQMQELSIMMQQNAQNTQGIPGQGFSQGTQGIPSQPQGFGGIAG